MIRLPIFMVVVGASPVSPASAGLLRLMDADAGRSEQRGGKSPQFRLAFAALKVPIEDSFIE
jgi:hypothetical protein